MREYWTIEHQRVKKGSKHKPDCVRKVSPHKKREVTNEIADPTKLKPHELPYSILDKIDRLIKKKLKSVTNEELMAYAKQLMKDRGVKEISVKDVDKSDEDKGGEEAP